MNLLALVVALSLTSASYGDAEAKVDHVHDGDTIVVNVASWPDIVGKKIAIRINGVDCPEINDPNPVIRAYAAKARSYTLSHCPVGSVIKLKDMGRDARFRIDAQVIGPDGVDVGAGLVALKLAHPYDGKHKRVPWTQAEIVNAVQPRNLQRRRAYPPSPMALRLRTR